MSISAIFGTRLAVPPAGGMKVAPKMSGGLMIECSSRPRKKATAHHKKTRPRKTQPWDINRKPAVYMPLPPLPPDWTLLEAAAPQSADALPETESATE